MRQGAFVLCSVLSSYAVLCFSAELVEVFLCAQLQSTASAKRKQMREVIDLVILM
jgi:hypothetical protein